MQQIENDMTFEVLYDKDDGKIIHGDNVIVLSTMDDNSVDSCISDFPYAIEFMGKNWDSAKHWNQGTGKYDEFTGTGYTGKKYPLFYVNTKGDTMKFYSWCYDRAEQLIRVLKPGGYVAIFGHPRTNHRMKCAFEDVGFKIVEEVEWVYLTGMPKNQDIGKLLDKADSPEMAKLYDGWKTAGLKPAHEPITIFQKPLDGTYIQNIEKYGCGGMNIDACRVPISQEDKEIMDAKASKNPTKGYWGKDNHIYGEYALSVATPANDLGRFPMNVILSEDVTELVDVQTGVTKSTGGSGDASRGGLGKYVYGQYKNIQHGEHAGGLGDYGGGSRLFTIIKYCPKPAPSEKTLPDGSRNTHVTVKPIELIKWLIKLLTPSDGTTIDITAGSCTHAVACSELNDESGYSLKWIDIEMTNTEDDPYCEIGKKRLDVPRQAKLF